MTLSYDTAETAAAKGWLGRYAEELVYNEIGAGWLVKSDVFWDLREKYKALPLADEIAWGAARNPLPGECEGYVPCYVDAIRITDARYLGLYPNGAHAAEAVAELVASLSMSLEGESAFDAEDEGTPRPDRSHRRRVTREKAAHSASEDIGPFDGA
jgi:hypothetical protein